MESANDKSKNKEEVRRPREVKPGETANQEKSIPREPGEQLKDTGDKLEHATD